jgi:1-acyl-sn-glycerol-3-phosphate acyltransferase
MLKTIRCVLLIINFFVGSIVGLLFCLARPFNPNNSYWFTRMCSLFGLPIIGVKAKVLGIENYPIDRPFIVVSNHQSNWDFIIIGGTFTY